MSSSRICKNCSHALPADFSDPTCPYCGASQGKVETPPQAGTPATHDDHFSLGPADDATVAHQPATPLPSTVPGAAPAVAFDPRHPPTFPNYSEVVWVNRGGMGDVYRAVQAGTGRVVALKVMRSSHAAFDQNLERFEKEVRALARVDHPAVVRVYEYGRCPAGPYYAMEFVPGRTLAERVRAGGGLTPAEAAAVIRAAAEGVHAAHQVGVLHRDLKPSNLMISDDGQVKVTDFGLAKHADETEEQTQTGVVVGTPSYMAPEQANADRKAEVTAAADVYGLGGTLYYLLTGRPPRDSGRHDRAIRQAARQPVPAPRALRPDLCPVLDAIVQKSLAHAPADRYATAQQFADELDNWVKKNPTIAVPPTPWERAARWVGRHRVAAAAAVLLPLLIGAAAVVRQKAEEARQEADPRVQLDKDLAGGRPTPLTRPDGLPRATAWLIGNVEPTLKAHDGGFEFEAQGTSILLLTGDPRHDRYRLDLEMKHATATAPTSHVGVYLGSGDEGGANTPGLFRGLSFDFRDARHYVPPGVNGVPVAPLARGEFRRNDRATVRTATAQESWTASAGSYLFAPAPPDGARPWRKVRLDVSPTDVVAYWDEPEGFVRAYAVPTADLAKATRDQAAAVAHYFPPGPVRLPEWTARGPVGVVASKAAVAVRNVVLTPASE